MDFILQYFPIILCCIALGASAGFLAGLLGVGGGIVLVPGLYVIFTMLHGQFGYDLSNLMHVCVGTSLAVIVPTGFSSSLAHYKKGNVDLKLVKMLGVGVVAGVIGGSVLAGYLDVFAMKMIFASALLVLSMLMMTKNQRFQIDPSYLRQPYSFMTGSVIGSLSTLIGIGGATLSVPYMNAHQVVIHKAVGTASALGLVVSIPATIGFMIIGYQAEGLPPFSLGYVNGLAWLCIVPISVLFAPLGVSVSQKTSISRLKNVFAVFVLLVALNMWRKILMGQ